MFRPCHQLQEWLAGNIVPRNQTDFGHVVNHLVYVIQTRIEQRKAGSFDDGSSAVKSPVIVCVYQKKNKKPEFLRGQKSDCVRPAYRFFYDSVRHMSLSSGGAATPPWFAYSYMIWLPLSVFMTSTDCGKRAFMLLSCVIAMIFNSGYRFWIVSKASQYA